MNDLFATIEESAEERQAIMEESGQSAESIAAELFRCEVQSVIRKCYPDGNAAAEYFVMVESKRGKESTDKLRDACREAWKLRKAADSMAGQA
jgi:hypothetical protein